MVDEVCILLKCKQIYQVNLNRLFNVFDSFPLLLIVYKEMLSSSTAKGGPPSPLEKAKKKLLTVWVKRDGALFPCVTKNKAENQPCLYFYVARQSFEQIGQLL